MAKNYYDIICIGTGITGLYFGYKSIYSKKRILFIEKDNRVGGRIKSLPLDDKSSYWAEGCATRFFTGSTNLDPLQSDVYVIQLLKQLSVNFSSLPNEDVQTNTDYTKVIEELFKTYPNLLNSYAKLSLPSELELKGYSSKKFSEYMGYPVLTEPMNLNVALRAFDKFSSDTQNIVNGGYEHVCRILYDTIKNHHCFKFNKNVNEIVFNKNTYIINKKYYASKVLFTGTVDQLNKININVTHLLDLKRKLIQKYFNYRAIRMYLKISDPWWTGKELFKKWNTGTPLNQVFYYNKDTISVYSSMESADILLYMIPEEYRNPDNFIEASKISKLSKFITTLLGNILKRENISINKIWYKYTKNAVQFIRPVETDYDEFIESIQQDKNFFMFSGDYTKNPGWVNSCLYIVEKKYREIMS